MATAHTLPPSPPTVESGRYTVGNHVVVLESSHVLVQGSWEQRDFLDFTSRNCKLGWLAKSLHIKNKYMHTLLVRLPLLAEIMSARNAQNTGSRRKRAMCPQVLDINIRDHTLQVDKNKRKCIVYILEKATLQFLVEEVMTRKDPESSTKPLNQSVLAVCRQVRSTE